MQNELETQNEWCFACGRLNPCGLKLAFEESDDTYITHFTGEPEHQGYDGIMHGGIVSTLLDEIMARYERELITELLEQNHYSLAKTADLLKISRHALRYRMQRLVLK